ncbi:MAG: hypothetical protein J7464_12175 [Chloroflexus sp.]|nr:hypothetical protein [Chloroflexus sp.]
MAKHDELPKRSRWLPLLALLAVLSWFLVIAMLIRLNLTDGSAIRWRLLFAIVAFITGITTFGSLERWLELPGLTVEGTLGVWLFLVTVAMIPAPTGTLLDPPDIPVYTLMLFAVFLCVAAICRPIIAVLSRRWITLRAWALDNRRVRREAYECGIFVATVLALAALRTLDPIKFIALAVILVLIEILFLSLIGLERA